MATPPWMEVSVAPKPLGTSLNPGTDMQKPDAARA